MKRVYPDHLYEPIRQEVAVSYVVHELKKMFPSLKRDEDAWQKISSDAIEWFDGAPFFYPVRDFWNTVHGIMMGFKLKIGLLEYLTAENVEWAKEDIVVKDLSLGVEMKEKTLEEVKSYFEETADRLNDRVIVTQKEIDGEDKMAVYDGNGRVRLAQLEEVVTVPAYVSRFVDKSRKPANYWVPTSLLMEVAYAARDAWREKKQALYKNYVEVIKDIVQESESGRHEMKTRALPEGDFRDRLLADLGI